MSKTTANSKKDVANQTQNNQPPPQPAEPLDIRIDSFVSKSEFEYLKTMASILSRFNVNGNNIIKSNNMLELIRGCLSATCNMYQYNVFPNTMEVVPRLTDKKAVRDFLAFRKKYMNWPIDMQLEELKNLGLVKAKKEDGN